MAEDGANGDHQDTALQQQLIAPTSDNVEEIWSNDMSLDVTTSVDMEETGARRLEVRVVLPDIYHHDHPACFKRLIIVVPTSYLIHKVMVESSRVLIHSHLLIHRTRITM